MIIDVNIRQKGESDEQMQKRIAKEREARMKQYEKDCRKEKFMRLLSYLRGKIKFLFTQIISGIIIAAISLQMTRQCESYDNSDKSSHKELKILDF